jgi:hypothetical protein
VSAGGLAVVVVVRWLMAQAPSPSTSAIAMAPPIQGVLFVSRTYRGGLVPGGVRNGSDIRRFLCECWVEEITLRKAASSGRRRMSDRFDINDRASTPTPSSKIGSAGWDPGVSRPPNSARLCYGATRSFYALLCIAGPSGRPQDAGVADTRLAARAPSSLAPSASSTRDSNSATVKGFFRSFRCPCPSSAEDST